MKSQFGKLSAEMYSGVRLKYASTLIRKNVPNTIQQYYGKGKVRLIQDGF